MTTEQLMTINAYLVAYTQDLARRLREQLDEYEEAAQAINGVLRPFTIKNEGWAE